MKTAKSGMLALSLCLASAWIVRGQAPAPPAVSYVGGQLRIDAVDTTVAEILAKVTAVTGVMIDVPPIAANQRMPVIKLGPGPAREILASLLNDSNLDYLIQASDADPAKIQSVMIMPRLKKGAKDEGTEVARSRSPFARGPAPSAEVEETPASEVPAPVQSENTAPVTPPADAQAAPAAAQPDQPVAPTSGPVAQPVQPGMMNGTRIGPMTPPAALNPPSISQQLQQMYQQRAQIAQQENQSAASRKIAHIRLSDLLLS